MFNRLLGVLLLLIIFTISASAWRVSGAGNMSPPLLIISNEVCNATGQTTATCTWNTNLSANTRVNYGLTTSYGSNVVNQSQVTSHSINISGLTQATLYHAEVVSKTGGQTATSSDLTFTTVTPLVNGSCGSSNGGSFSSAPTTNLCSAGTPTTVMGTGPWTWNCNGSGGGTNASCSAQLSTQPVNGTCGPANGVPVTSAPTSGLCNSGTASAVTGNGPWNWTCNGINGGTIANCSAPVQIAGSDPTVSVLPYYNDTYANWKNAGLLSVGGISANEPTTQCGTTLIPLGGGLDDYSNIVSHLSACTSGTYFLMSGAFIVHVADISRSAINVPSGVVLRGVGACSGTVTPYTGTITPICPTSITVSDGTLPYTGGTCSNGSCPNGGPQVIHLGNVQPNAGSPSWANCGINGNFADGVNCGAAVLTADAQQGDMTIHVNSTTNFAVGRDVLLDEASGAGWLPDPIGTNGFTDLWSSLDWFNSTGGGPKTAKIQYPKSLTGGWNFSQYPYQDECTYTFCDRKTEEIHKITSINASAHTITFDDPLTIAYRVAGPITFNGAISGTALTTSSDSCQLIAGQLIQGVSVTDGSYVASVTSCSGGVGHYILTQSSTVSSEAMTGAAHVAHAYWAANNPCNGSCTVAGDNMDHKTGLENLSIERATTGAVAMDFCENCWIKNVETGFWYGGGVIVGNLFRSELNGVYSHHAANALSNGGEYAISIDAGTTELLLTNSITNFGGKGMVARGGGAGSVVSYNYMDDTMYDKHSGTGDYWVDLAANGSHSVGPHDMLFEGNWSDNLDNDHTHGSSSYITFFKNWGTALRTPFTDPSIPTSVNDLIGVGMACGTPTTCTAAAPVPLRAIGPQGYNYWFAYVGNVLGVSGATTSGNGFGYSSGTNCSKYILCLGWNDGPGGQDKYINGTNGTYIFLHGDYDYFHSSIFDWNSSSLCGSGTSCSHTLPNSFYLSGAPSFFSGGASCTYTWPWVTPTDSLQIQTPGGGGSCSSYSGLPAKARWDAGTPFIQP